MPFSVGKGTPKNIMLASVGVGGAPKEVLSGWVGVGGVPKQFYASAPPLSASASPSTVSGTIGNIAGVFIGNSGATTASAVGGSGVITYFWRKVSGPLWIDVGTPTQASTVFTYNHSSSIPSTAVFVCDVTRGGVTAASNQVTVNFN